ncbi:MAG TPA: hypothetical protein VHG35_14410 [Gemmatimonadales bacterium]|nr:hypothetical protein [Gemmatimonadales bacterium]
MRIARAGTAHRDPAHPSGEVADWDWSGGRIKSARQLHFPGTGRISLPIPATAAAERFLREGRQAARLRHSNVRLTPVW